MFIGYTGYCVASSGYIPIQITCKGQFVFYMYGSSRTPRNDATRMPHNHPFLNISIVRHQEMKKKKKKKKNIQRAWPNITTAATKQMMMRKHPKKSLIRTRQYQSIDWLGGLDISGLFHHWLFLALSLSTDWTRSIIGGMGGVYNGITIPNRIWNFYTHTHKRNHKLDFHLFSRSREISYYVSRLLWMKTLIRFVFDFIG